MSRWLEIPVFIHGIILEDDPVPHDGEYDSLLELVNEELMKISKPAITEESIKGEWGWGQSTGKDKILAEVQAKITKKTMPTVKDAGDFTLIPHRWLLNFMRTFFIRGVSDLFYYISADGEKALRDNLFKLLSEAITDRLDGNSENNVSLTFFAYSAGSVITHDFLFHLIRKPDEKKSLVYAGEMNKIRKWARLDDPNRRIRIRKVYSFGSPITPMMIRSHSLMKKILEDEKIDPSELGFISEEGLSNPRWVNYWDKDDVLAFPLEYFYAEVEGKKIVADEYLDTSDLPHKAHTKYWKSRKMARHIAGNI